MCWITRSIVSCVGRSNLRHHLKRQLQKGILAVAKEIESKLYDARGDVVGGILLRIFNVLFLGSFERLFLQHWEDWRESRSHAAANGDVDGIFRADFDFVWVLVIAFWPTILHVILKLFRKRSVVTRNKSDNEPLP